MKIERRDQKKTFFGAEDHTQVYQGEFTKSRQELFNLALSLIPRPFAFQGTYELKGFKGREKGELGLTTWGDGEEPANHELLYVRSVTDGHESFFNVTTPFLRYDGSELVNRVEVHPEGQVQLPSFYISGFDPSNMKSFRIGLKAFGSNPVMPIPVFSPVVREEILLELDRQNNLYCLMRVSGQNLFQRLDPEKCEKLVKMISG